MKSGESAAQGLSGEDASRKLKVHGYNELAEKQQRTGLHIVWEVMREPMFLLLIVAGSIYLIPGDSADAFMLFGFFFIALGITMYQDRRTERVLETMKDLSSPRTLVIRDGRQIRISGRGGAG